MNNYENLSEISQNLTRILIFEVNKCKTNHEETARSKSLDSRILARK